MSTNVRVTPREDSRGFTLIELLMVVAIIGIIASIAIPNLVSALDRARQTTTVSAMRGIAVALAIYQQDTNLYPTAANMDEVKLALQDSKTVASEDGWHRPFIYTHTVEDHYTLESYGKDGIQGQPISPDTRGNFLLDIVIIDGAFTASIQ